MQRVINFSGGRTSALMTILEYKPGDIVIFCDTGREHPKTYKFIHDFEAFENIPVVRLMYPGGFKRLIEKRQMIPNISMRFCTIELKIKTARRYLRSLGITGYINFVGFRYDEPKRVKNRKSYWKKVTDRFTLFDAKLTKANVVDYWKHQDYDLETPSILGNCDLCFLKGKGALIAIMKQHPELADKWIEDEERMGATYIKDTTYRKLLEISKRPEVKQTDLFELEPAFNCACTS